MMETYLYYLAAVVVGYLLGSIPCGVIVGRVTRGIDVRDYGSGRTGTTNALRVLGWRASVVVLVGDVAKAWLPAYLLAQLLSSADLAAAAALAALVGHNWPLFAGFRGGRGVTVGFGGILAMLPLAGLAGLVTFLVVVASTRYVSAGSVAATAAVFVAALVLATQGLAQQPYVWYAAAGAALIIVQHRDNLDRLRRGTERKLGETVEVRGRP